MIICHLLDTIKNQTPHTFRCKTLINSDIYLYLLNISINQILHTYPNLFYSSAIFSIPFHLHLSDIMVNQSFLRLFSLSYFRFIDTCYIAYLSITL